jgi:hypothetical protein
MPSAHAPQAAAKTLILSPKDEGMLAAFRVYRYLTALDVAHLGLYSHKSLTFVRERLSRLCGNIDLTDKDFIEGYPLLRFGFPGVRGNRERIFCLSLSGRKIVESLGYPVSFHVKPAKLATFSHSHLTHTLTLNRTVIAFSAWARSKPNLTVECQLYELAKHPPVVSIDYHEEQLHKSVPVKKILSTIQTAKQQGLPAMQTLLKQMAQVAVIPDALILVTNIRSNQRLLILLEIDHNTHTKPRFIEHLLSRLAYVKSPHITNTYGTIPYRIAWAVQGITDEASKSRLQSMLSWTKELLTERKRFEEAQNLRFTTINFPTLYEDAQNLIEGPVWYRPDAPKTAVPLLTGENPQPTKDSA